jgi:hypothetical protein
MSKCGYSAGGLLVPEVIIHTVTSISGCNLVCTTSLWNNLLQVRSMFGKLNNLKSWEWEHQRVQTG